jgi:hypothetical protein
LAPNKNAAPAAEGGAVTSLRLLDLLGLLILLLIDPSERFLFAISKVKVAHTY